MGCTPSRNRTDTITDTKNNKYIDSELLESFWEGIDTGNSTLVNNTVSFIDVNDESSFPEVPIIYAAHLG